MTKEEVEEVMSAPYSAPIGMPLGPGDDLLDRVEAALLALVPTSE